MDVVEAGRGSAVVRVEGSKSSTTVTVARTSSSSYSASFFVPGAVPEDVPMPCHSSSSSSSSLSSTGR